MEENLLEIQRRLRMYMLDNNLTPEKIEKKCECTAGSVHRFMRGDGSFSMANLQKLGDGCPGLNIDWLINGRGSMNYSRFNHIIDEPQHTNNDLTKQLLDSKDDVIRALNARIETQDAYLKLLTEKYIKSIDLMLERTDEQSQFMEMLKNRKRVTFSDYPDPEIDEAPNPQEMKPKHRGIDDTMNKECLTYEQFKAKEKAKRKAKEELERIKTQEELDRIKIKEEIERISARKIERAKAKESQI